MGILPGMFILWVVYCRFPGSRSSWLAVGRAFVVVDVKSIII